MEGSPTDQRPASTWRRLVAYVVLDGVLVGLLIFAALTVLWVVFGPTTQFVDGTRIQAVVDDGRAILDGVVAALLAAAYFSGSWVGFGRTPGQAALGVRVVRATDGSRLGIGRAVVRWLALGAPIAGLAMLGPATADLPGGRAWLSVAGAIWLVLLLITTVVDPLGRGLHDRLAGSRATR